METAIYMQPLSEDVRDLVYKRHGFSRAGLEKDIDAILKWFDTQPHLPVKLSRKVIFSYLIISKGSIEMAKQKIDNYFTCRSRLTDFFSNSNPRYEKLINFHKHMYIIPLPKLNRDLSRIIIMKMRETDDAFDATVCFQYTMNIAEMRLREDICHGDQFIYDGEHVKIHHMASVTPAFMKKMFLIVEKTLKLSVTGFHILNASPYLVNFFNMAKTFLKPKLANRVVFHKSIDTVYAAIDKDILPKDYGGNEKSLDELSERLQKAFVHYQDFYDERDTWKVKEELRPEKIENDDFYGYQGNFKKLEVD